MRKIIASFSSVMLVLTLTGCGYQGQFRYPCQDTANWDKAECNPPICESTGTCSKDIVGEKVWNDYQESKVKNG
jgi:predicted small lipoprotein YifL